MLDKQVSVTRDRYTIVCVCVAEGVYSFLLERTRKCKKQKQMENLQWPLAVDLGLACANPRSDTANNNS